MDAHLWLAQSENIAQRLRDAPHVRWSLPPHAALLEAATACARPESPAEIIEYLSGPEQCSGQAKRIGAPSRIRTYDTRFRKPLLYPLSYEG